MILVIKNAVFMRLVAFRKRLLKHDKKEMFGMCKAVEDYANKQGIRIYIEATMKYSDLSEDKIIEEVVNRFNITKEEAKEYYDECSSLE